MEECNSEVYGIPRCTLQTRVFSKTESKPGPPTKLSFEQEQKLVDYAGNRAPLDTVFDKRSLMIYASQFAHSMVQSL